MAGEWAKRLLRAAVVVAVLLSSAALLPLGSAAAVPPSTVAYSVGVFDPAEARWYLLGEDGGTTAIDFGHAGDIPLAGDWDGDGRDTPAVYRPEEGRLVVRNGLDPISFIYAMPPGGLPVVADTDGDGRDTVSLARFGRLYVMDGLGEGPPVLTGADPLPISLPEGTEQLIGGDFDGDGRDEIAAVHHGVAEVVTPGRWAILGEVGTLYAVAGDWDGDGVASLGSYDAWQSEFRLPEEEGVLEEVAYGSTGMLPVAGRFGGLPADGPEPPHETGVPPLAEGDSGALVVALQRELDNRGLYRGELDGIFGPELAQSVVAFHKVLGLERTFAWEQGDSDRLAAFALPPLPDRPQEPDRIEVDIGRQVLFLFEGGVVTEIIPVSTGGTYQYYSERQGAVVWAGTPRGDFTLIRHSLGWNCDPVTGWCIYNPWNFNPYYAVHGYNSVPPNPASHGCVRLPVWESNHMESRFFLGMPVHLWDEYNP